MSQLQQISRPFPTGLSVPGGLLLRRFRKSWSSLSASAVERIAREIVPGASKLVARLRVRPSATASDEMFSFLLLGLRSKRLMVQLATVSQRASATANARVRDAAAMHAAREA